MNVWLVLFLLGPARGDEVGTEPAVQQEIQARKFEPKIVAGASELGMSADFVYRANRGIELIFLRDYKGAKDWWDLLEADYPGTAVRHVGRVLIYQALMLENLDYRFEKQYRTHSKLALEDLDEADAQPGNEAWEAFLRGGVEGIESIHLMRKNQYLPALTLGLDAIRALERLEKVAPDFVDPVLGQGLYKFWRAVVAKKTRLIPPGEKNGQENGILAMKQAEREALFVSPAATLALSYAYLEEKKLGRATASLRKNQRLYPDNVINNMVLARALILQRKLDEALVLLKHIESIDTDNHRVHYYRATVWLRKNNLSEAHASIDRYLGFTLEKKFRAIGLHRKGEIHQRAREVELAKKFYREAVDTDDYGPSKSMLVRLEKQDKKR
ncbi:MAG: hypothetical protein VX519_03365 [Myxococcota bacterium]|nr:hypothetical protein [Myxococcota bacterium]